MEDWHGIAAEVAEALGEVGFTVILEKPGEDGGDPWNPGPGEPTQHPITVVQQYKQVRDASGTLIAQTQHTLLISTEGGVIPAKEDAVIINGERREVLAVRPVSPGNVDLLYEVDVQI